jgi:D-glycero-D-manno-heptose 1,7-bisphosphate phosphatase
MKSSASAVFLDRDGVINRPPPDGLYIASPDDFILLPGVVEAICRLNHSGFRVFVVTNQRGIARGLVSAQIVEEIHAWLQQAVCDSGGSIDHIYVCPHDAPDGCACRKPKPGMLQQAARVYSLHLASCWMVGDKASDIAAGRAAGCRTVLMSGSRDTTADFSAANLAAAVDYILAEARSGIDTDEHHAN